MAMSFALAFVVHALKRTFNTHVSLLREFRYVSIFVGYFRIGS